MGSVKTGARGLLHALVDAWEEHRGHVGGGLSASFRLAVGDDNIEGGLVTVDSIVDDDGRIPDVRGGDP
jgi:hypothetical protein